MASLKSFFKNKSNFPQFSEKLSNSKITKNQSDFVELAAKYIDVLIALEKADSTSSGALLERLEAVASNDFITQNAGEIVASSTMRRLSFLEEQIKETKSGKTDKTGETNTVGSAYLRLDAHIKKMIAYNENTDAGNRVYISLSTSRKDNGNGIGKVRVNATATKDYFTQNERLIIKHNVLMGIFKDSVRYLNKDETKRMEAIAKEYGYKA